MASVDHAKCRRCGSQYLRSLPSRKDQDPDRGICASPLCWAIEMWTPEQWEGAARMAENRKACAIPLTSVDIEALHRARTGKAMTR